MVTATTLILIGFHPDHNLVTFPKIFSQKNNIVFLATVEVVRISNIQLLDLLNLYRMHGYNFCRKMKYI